MITNIALFSLFAKNFAYNLETQPTRIIGLKSPSSTGLEPLGIKVKNVALVPYSAFPYYGILKAYQESISRKSAFITSHVSQRKEHIINRILNGSNHRLGAHRLMEVICIWWSTRTYS